MQEMDKKPEESLDVQIKHISEINFFLETTLDLMEQLLPKLKELTEEVAPTVNSMRAKLDRDEIILLLEKVVGNIDTFLRMLEMLEVTKELTNQMTPMISRLSEEIMPAINRIRVNIDREETLILVEKLTENIEPAVRLMDLTQKYRQDGTLDAFIELLSRPAMGNMIHTFASLSDEEIEGVAKSAIVMTNLLTKLSQPKVVCMLDSALEAIIATNLDSPRAVGTFGLISATRDEDVKKTTGILVDFLKNFSRCAKMEDLKVESSR
jgi:uncharacterized protein YjgD (DUF1641 family)